MLLSDGLILIGVTLLSVGVTGVTLLDTSRGPLKSGVARPHPGRPAIIRGSIQALLRWRPEGGQPAARRTSPAEPRVDARCLTGSVCRLADGSMGRVAIIGASDEEWTAVCVPG